MGTRHSKASAPTPTLEPAALLTTSAGVIVRVSDPTTGASSFQHNPRFLQPATVSDVLQAADADSRHGAIAQDVMVATAGGRNRALRNKVVYVKKPPRPSTSPTAQTKGA